MININDSKKILKISRDKIFKSSFKLKNRKDIFFGFNGYSMYSLKK